MGKVISWEELAKVSEELKKQGKKIVTTNGIFDLMHIGHVGFLKLAKQQGDVLFVGINSDESTRKLKGPTRPVFPQDQRAEILAALEMVDYVAIFNETDPRAFLEQVKPHVHVKGDDYDPEKMVETPIVRKHGGEVRIVSFRPDSTTNIINRIYNSAARK
ncbi:MAG: adenylyltransferase/cytidyltransferase family protein [Candidatus Woesearchaeota archaeon]